MVTWLVNGVSPESKGLTLVGGSFRTQGVSSCTFEANLDLETTEAFAHNTAVTLTRVEGGVSVPFFQGKIRQIPKSASPDSESHTYVLEDAWADLEATIYQEEWALGAGAYFIPKSILGICKNTLGTAFIRCDIGQQIKELIRFAIDECDIALQMGDCPAGEILWPQEMANVSIAELIRLCLRFHPDWIPWIDHTTTPPTFQVTPISTAGSVAGLSTLTIALTGADMAGLQITKRDDMLPDAVRIFYEYATTIDNEVYRNGVIDKYPLLAADAGPRILTTTIPLQGLQMQTQKSPVQVRKIPTDETDETVKAWLKIKFPHLADIPDAAFNVTQFERFLPADADAHPDPINPNATRLSIADVDDLPNELLRGQINDWMRVKVGKVGINIAIEKEGDWSTATAAAKAAWKKGVRNIAALTATNATTKVYKGLSQWAAPEDVPAGIAQAIYTAFHAACNFEGSFPILEDEISATRRYGKKVNITGGLAAWATMNAPVHSVDWDIATGRSVISFGPIPQLAPQDFLELQHMIRQRTTRWWSIAERTSNTIGADGVPSAAGDTVVGYDLPLTDLEPADRSLENLNLQIFEGEVQLGDGFYKIINFDDDAVTPATILYFRNGLYVGTTDPDDGTTPTVKSVWNFTETS